MSKLYLHSSKATNNVFNLDKKINGSWKLLSFHMTNNLYNVSNSNNTIYIDEGGIERVITLNNGFYDINSLKTELTTSINAITSGTFTITIDTDTRKYSFSSTANFGFTFGSNSSNSARKLIGMNATDDSQATSHSSDIPIDLNAHKNLFIRISQDDNNDVLGLSYFHTSLAINGAGSFGDLYTFVSDDNYDQYVRFKQNTKKLEISFHDVDNNTVELNSDYAILFEKVGIKFPECCCEI